MDVFYALLFKVQESMTFHLTNQNHVANNLLETIIKDPHTEILGYSKFSENKKLVDMANFYFDNYFSKENITLKTITPNQSSAIIPIRFFLKTLENFEHNFCPNLSSYNRLLAIIINPVDYRKPF